MKVICPNLNIKIAGHGFAVPEQSVDNLELLKQVPMFQGKSDSHLKKIEERMLQGFGFEKRHLSIRPGQALHSTPITSESLGLEASQKALAQAQMKPEIFIHGSTTSSRYTGSQSTALAGALDLNIPAYDTKAGCSTGLAAIHMAYSFMNSGYQNCLVTCSEILSHVTNPQNPEMWFGLADASASLFFENKHSKDDADFFVEKSVYSTEGKHVNLLSTPGLLPPTAEIANRGDYFLKGDPEALRREALRKYGELLDVILPIEERKSIRWIICHQVNRQIIIDVKNNHQLDGEPFWINHRYGSVGGATIPLSLSLALNDHVFSKGDRILLISVGGGLSAAAQIWTWLK